MKIIFADDSKVVVAVDDVIDVRAWSTLYYYSLLEGDTGAGREITQFLRLYGRAVLPEVAKTIASDLYHNKLCIGQRTHIETKRLSEKKKRAFGSPFARR